jgi:hypothetical protein
VYKTRAAVVRKKKQISTADVAVTVAAADVGADGGTVKGGNPKDDNLTTVQKDNLPDNLTTVQKDNLPVNVEGGTDNSIIQNEVTTPFSHHGTLPIFLNEPFKNHTLQLDVEKVEKLNGDNWLCTYIIDFLLRHGLPPHKPYYVLVPTSDLEPVLDYYNAKSKSTVKEDIEMVANIRKLYKNFTTKQFRITTITVNKGLFYVIDMTFDATDADGDYFQNITVYDSLVRSDRNRGAQLKNSFAISLFKKIQDFFYNYIIFDVHSDIKENYKQQVLKEIGYAKCPIPQNKYDSSLFAIAIVLHLVRAIRVTERIFTQQNITYFRKSLYIVLTAPPEELHANPKVHISTDFIMSFFDKMFFTSSKRNYFLKYLHKCTNYVSPTKKNNQKDQENNEDQDDDDEHSFVDFTEATTNNNSAEENHQSNNDNNNPNEVKRYFNTIFRHVFVNSMDEDEKFEMNNLDELYRKITHYQIESNIVLRKQKSCPKTGYCFFTCVSHKNCSFFASFGPNRSSKKIVLKKNHLYHKGVDREGVYDNGNIFKTRCKEIITPLIDTVRNIKNGEPVPNDIVKAAKVLNGERINYDQAQKGLLRN